MELRRRRRGVSSSSDGAADDSELSEARNSAVGSPDTSPLLEADGQKFLNDTAGPWSVFLAVISLGKRLYRRNGEQSSLSTFLLLLLLLVVLLAANTAVSLWFSFVLRSFTTALQEKKEEAFYTALLRVMQIIAVMIPAHAGKRFAAGKLSLFLRDKFTTALFRGLRPTA